MRIIIALATHNRPIITELCLQNLQSVRDPNTKLVVYDDNSDAYSLDYLKSLSDEVNRLMCVKELRGREHKLFAIS